MFNLKQTMRMKKILLSLCIILLTVACTEQGRWNREQRQQIRRMLNDYRELSYLDDMTDAEFIIFSDDVAEVLEIDYPNYSLFMAMPAQSDSVESVLVETIVEQIEANYRNMRHLFPYQTLVDSQVLPAGMNRSQLLAYYTCVAQSVNNYFGSLQSFIYAALNSATDDNVIADMLQSCASPYWSVESVTVVETTN